MNRVLLDLQHLDSQILGLSRARKALDDGTTARQKRDATRALLEEARQQERVVAKTRQAREGELEAIEQKIARQKARLASSSSAGDVSAFERDLPGLAHARSELDDTILNLMDEGENWQTRVKELEAQLQKDEAEAARIEAEFAKESAQLDAQIARKRAERPAISEKLSPQESEKYVAAFKKHGGLGVSETKAGACSACGTTLSRDFLRDAPREAFPQCESCSRLIYVEGA